LNKDSTVSHLIVPPAACSPIGYRRIRARGSCCSRPAAATIKEADLFLTEAVVKALGKATTSSLDFGGYLLTLDTAENKALLAGLKTSSSTRLSRTSGKSLVYDGPDVLAGAVKVGGNDPKVEMASVSKATFTRPNGPISIENSYTKQAVFIGRSTTSSRAWGKSHLDSAAISDNRGRRFLGAAILFFPPLL
jgi:hypothetical protein